MLRRSIQLNPKHHQALNSLAYLWANENRNLAEAEKLLTRALELSPNNPGYQDTLAWIYHQKGRYQEAHALLLLALEKLPLNPEILEHLGQVQLRLGRQEDALKSWTLALPNSSRPKELQALIDDVSKGRLATLQTESKSEN
ncbi:MAG: tetratricopeptide repeat protein [Blastochloris sp.]|nr:tetratricopeptide repeat protein [Blastochloris sp.]